MKRILGLAVVGLTLILGALLPSVSMAVPAAVPEQDLVSGRHDHLAYL